MPTCSRTRLVFAAMAVVAMLAAAAACTLNPQPLPPIDEPSASGDDIDAGTGFGSADAAARPDTSESPPARDSGGVACPDSGVSDDDAGDAGDAGSDASAPCREDADDGEDDAGQGDAG